MKLNPKLTIMYIDESTSIGGAEIYLKMIMQYFSITHKIYLVHPDDEQHADFYKDVNAEKLLIKADSRKDKMCLLVDYCRTIRSRRPDILHANLPAPTHCRSAIIAAKILQGIHILSTVHLPNIVNQRSILGKVAGKMFLDCLVNRLVFTSIECSIVVSKSGIVALAKNYPVVPDKIECIFNGIDMSRFIPVSRDRAMELKNEFKILSGETILTSIGRLHPQKGYEFLLNAIPKLGERAHRVKLILVGDGPSRSELTEITKKLSIEHLVVFAGHRTNIPEILAITDIYINSSLDEGMPLSILEAMGSGVAVIATSIGGNSEIVVKDWTGILVPPKNSQTLSEAILLLLENPDYRALLGQRGKSHAIDKYSVERMFLETECVYQKIMVSKEGRSMHPPSIPRIIATSVPEEAGGGIVSLHLMLSGINNRFELILFPASSPKPYAEKILPIIARLVKKYTEFYQCLKHNSDVRIVHINTSPDKKGLMRDVVFVILSKVLKRKVVFQIHGGYGDYKLTYLVSKIAKAAMLKCDAILIFSISELNKISEIVGTKPKKVVLSNAVKVSDFSDRESCFRRDLLINDCDKVILFLGRLVVGKGVYELIAAIVLILPKFKTVTFVIAGDGPEKSNMMDLCNTTGIGEHVRFPGYLSYENVIAAFAAADIFVLPSYSEAMPMTILQALASGVSIVATSVGAIPEILQDGINGFLIQPKNVQQLVDKILELLGNDGLRNQIENTNFELAKNKYDLHTLIEKLSRLYAEI